MRMHNARQAIHDAFALHDTYPGMVEGGGSTKYDSDRAIFNGMKAGLIIRAVLNQRVYLRGCALLMNAADSVVNQEEVYALKAKIWMEFLNRTNLNSRAQAEVMAISDELILGHKFRCWDHLGNRFAVHALAQLEGRSDGATKRIIHNSNLFLDILTRIDNERLKPVWDVINDQREKYNAANNALTA